MVDPDANEEDQTKSSQLPAYANQERGLRLASYKITLQYSLILA